MEGRGGGRGLRGESRVLGGGQWSLSSSAPGLRRDTSRVTATAHRAISATPLRVERMEVKREDIPPRKHELNKWRSFGGEEESVCG